jgi:alkanesulfonate monooxygenase SsuD/methylene tetrahydromethanopterin reductase-like flavin-dependent oxidoreductase (luciferase family)
MSISTDDRLELHELPGRYGDAIDDRDWPALDRIFTTDAVFDMTDLGIDPLVGLAEIKRFMDEDAQHPKTHTMTNIEAARARNRKTLQGYVALPNYRNYWIDAGYEEEMSAVSVALEARDKDGVLAAMSNRWLDDCTLSGSAGRVRDGVEAWFDAGVTSPILVPSSTSGGQNKAFSELFDTFSS